MAVTHTRMSLWASEKVVPTESWTNKRLPLIYV